VIQNRRPALVVDVLQGRRSIESAYREVSGRGPSHVADATPGERNRGACLDRHQVVALTEACAVARAVRSWPVDQQAQLCEAICALTGSVGPSSLGPCVSTHAARTRSRAPATTDWKCASHESAPGQRAARTRTDVLGAARAWALDNRPITVTLANFWPTRRSLHPRMASSTT